MYFTALNEKLAYILGLLAADGWATENGIAVYLALKRSDKATVEFVANSIAEEIGTTHIGVEDYMAKLKNKEYPACRAKFKDYNLRHVLEKYGIIPSKSYIDIDYLANIPDNLKMAWIYGYFDGDGSLSIGKNIVVIFTGRNEFLHILCDYIGYSTTYRKVNDETSTASIYRKQDIHDFLLGYIEFSKRVPVMHRKLERAKQVVGEHKYVIGNTDDGKVYDCICISCDNKFRSRFNNIVCSECNRMEQASVMPHKCKYCNAIITTKDKICNSCKGLLTNDNGIYICSKCGKPIAGKGKHGMCHECTQKLQERVNLPDDVLAELLKTKNFSQIGREYGISATAVRKRAQRAGLY